MDKEELDRELKEGNNALSELQRTYLEEGCRWQEILKDKITPGDMRKAIGEGLIFLGKNEELIQRNSLN